MKKNVSRKEAKLDPKILATWFVEGFERSHQLWNNYLWLRMRCVFLTIEQIILITKKLSIYILFKSASRPWKTQTQMSVYMPQVHKKYKITFFTFLMENRENMKNIGNWPNVFFRFLKIVFECSFVNCILFCSIRPRGLWYV